MKTLELNDEQQQALRRLLSKNVEGASMMTHAIFIHPAEQLRRRANEIEQDERDYPILQTILKALD